MLFEGEAGASNPDSSTISGHVREGHLYYLCCCLLRREFWKRDEHVPIDSLVLTSTLVYLNIKQCFHIDRIHNEKCMNDHEPNLLAVNQAITHGGHAYKLHIYTLPHTPHVHTT